MIDIHSHILPGIDDGAKTMEKTLEMLRIAENNGIRQIIATPHFYKGYYENNYADVCKVIDEVNKKIEEEGIDVQLFPGQELFLDKYSPKFYREGIIKGLNSTRYLLMEFPMESMPKDVLDIIYELRIQGAVPVIAHPERYKYIIEKPSLINNFIDEGCLFQINSGSIEGVFGKRVQKTSETLISHGICNFIASDAHSANVRCPKLKEALDIANRLNKDIRLDIVNNTEMLLSNHEIKRGPEKIKEKRSIFSFFKK